MQFPAKSRGKMYGKRREKASKTAESYTESYTPNQILHPILHPKSLVNTGYLRHGCRKCRLFFKNFFCGKRNNGDFILRVLGIIKASIASLSLNDNSAEDAKHRTSLGKSTDVLHRKYGCLPQRSPMFSETQTTAPHRSPRWRRNCRRDCTICRCTGGFP